MHTHTLPQTTAERDALFDQMFATVEPAERRPLSLKKILGPFRRQIRKKQKQGYSLRQIADRLKEPPFGIAIAPATLSELLGSGAARRRAKIKKLARLRAKSVAAAQPATSALTPTAARA